MSKKYIIDKKLLLVLLEESIELEALENSGVDNWCGYSDSIRKYLEDGLNETYDSISDVAYDEIDSFLLTGWLEEVE